jgi:putative ABC transport system permease protein
VFMGGGVVLKNRVGERAARGVQLEASDVTRLEALRGLEAVTPNIMLANEVVRHGARSKLLTVVGWNDQAGLIRNFVPAAGRFLSPLDVERGGHVVFLGPESKQRLFGDAPALGERVQIRDRAFRVIGVGTAKGSQLSNGGNRDDLMAVIPYTTALRAFSHDDEFNELVIRPVRQDGGAELIPQVRALVGLHEGFSPGVETAMWSADFWDSMRTVYGMFDALQAFFVVAGVTTLFVGGIGVMNIMLVVVGERTFEIGLRKAVGARSSEIFVQFLTEAVVVSLFAGVLGALGGFGLVRLLAPALEATGIHLPTTPDAVTTVVVTLSLVGVAVVAGVFPALRAARIPPAEALRAS